MLTIGHERQGKATTDVIANTIVITIVATPRIPKIVSQASIKFEKLMQQMDGGNDETPSVLPKLKSATGPLYKHFKHEMAQGSEIFMVLV